VSYLKGYRYIDIRAKHEKMLNKIALKAAKSEKAAWSVHFWPLIYQHRYRNKRLPYTVYLRFVKLYGNCKYSCIVTVPVPIYCSPVPLLYLYL